MTEQHHETIWLAPSCDACATRDYDRTWCQDNVYDPCPDCDRMPVKYVLAPDQPQPPAALKD